MAINAGTVVSYLELDTGRFRSSLRGAGAQLSQFADESNSLSTRIGALGGAFKTVGASLTKGLTVPLIGASVALTKFSKDFNAEMANVATLIPDSTERVKELKAEIQELAIGTGKATSDIADGTYQVISAFGDTADTLKITEINAKAATAGVATTTDAINLTSAVTKGYGDITAKAVEHASDLAFQTVKLGQTTFPELASSLGKVVPLSKQLGVSQEEMFTIFATGTGVTGTASEVSTQYRGVLQALMAPTKSMSGLFQELGIENGEAMIKQYGLMGAMEKIVDIANESGAPLQDYIGSIEGQTIALALTGAQSDIYKDKLRQMSDASGATMEAFNAQTQGINASGFAWEQAKQSMVVAAQRMGDTLAPALKSVSKFIIRITEKLNSMSEGQRELIAKIGMIVAALGPVLLILGKLVSIVKTISIVFSTVSTAIGVATGAVTGATGAAATLGTVFSALTGPIGIVIASIAGLVAVFRHLYEVNESFRNKVNEIWNEIKESIKRSIDLIVEKIEEVVLSIRQWIDENEQFFNDLYVIIAKIVMTAITAFENMLNSISPLILALFSICQRIFEDIGVVIKSVVEVIKHVIGLISAIIQGDWKRVWEEFKGIVTSVIKGLIDIAITWGKNFIGMFVDGIKGMFGTIKETVKGVANIIADFLGFSSPTKRGPCSMSDSWGKNFIIMFANSIKNSKTLVESAVKEVAKRIKDFLGFSSPTKEGPASNSDKWAPNFMDMFNQGIVDNTPKVAKSSETVAQKVADALAKVNGYVENTVSIIEKKFELWKLKNQDVEDSSKLLEKQLEMQKEKHELLNVEIKNTQQALEVVAQKYGENSAEAIELRNKLLDLQIQQENLNNSLEETRSSLDKAADSWKKYYKEMSKGVYKSSSGGGGGGGGSSKGKDVYYNEDTNEYHVFDDDGTHTVIDSDGNMRDATNDSPGTGAHQGDDGHWYDDTGFMIKHDGGPVRDTGKMRVFSPFTTLLDFFNSLGNNEVPAILEDDEFVLSGDMISSITNAARSLKINRASSVNGLNINLNLDYEKLGRSVAKYIKPNVTNQIENHFSPAESTPSKHAKAQERMLREIAFKY